MAVTYFGLLALSVVLFAGTANSDPYCCTFVGYDCNWDYGTVGSQDNYRWKWTVADGLPVTGYIIPDTYNIGTRHPASLYLQYFEMSGYANATASSANFYLYHNDEITIDVYRYITYSEGGARPILYFHDLDSGLHLALDLEWDPNWVTNSFKCGDALTCCVDYPCLGYLELVGIIYDRNELLAIDNIGINGGCISPSYPTCCEFSATDSCTADWSAAGGVGWSWYPTSAPNPVGLKYAPPTGDYEWTQYINAATLFSTQYDGVSSSTNFAFAVWGDVNPTSATFGYLNVVFNPVGGSPVSLYTVRDTAGVWTYYSIDCSAPSTSCCGTAPQPCKGSLEFIAYTSYPADFTLFAVDNVEKDYACGDPTCCTFSTSDFCGWENPSLNWRWSGVSTPTPPPPAGNVGDYAWLQVSGSAIADAKLISPLITGVVDATSFFTIQYYITLNPGVSSDQLYIYFKPDSDTSSGSGNLLATAYITGGVWIPMTFTCANAGIMYGTYCCGLSTASACQGRLVIDASHATGIDLFAIDNLDFDGNCV